MHSQICVTEVYAHILDEDRKINAQKFEMAFYADPEMRKTVGRPFRRNRRRRQLWTLRYW